MKVVQGYLSIADKDKAFEWLGKSSGQPLWGYENAPSSLFLDPLRDDPRFEQLLRKLNLPNAVIAKHLAR